MNDNVSQLPVGRNNNNESQTQFEPSHHVYGGKAALTFQCDVTKGTERKPGVPTMAIDGALATGPKQYDWNKKIRIQLTVAELPVVCAVFMGLLERCQFQNHGQDNNKGFEFEHQGDKVFCKLFGPGQVIAVPVSMPDVFQVSSLFTRQFRKGHPWISSVSDIMNLLSKTVAR